MFGLSANLTMATQALEADTGAITVTNNNIANANTAGYDRQIADLSSVALVGEGGSQDGGVSFDGYTVVRNQLLQIGINNQTSTSASLTAQSTLWAQIENAFSSTSSGLGTALSSFYSNLSELSTDPQNAANRETAFSSATQLVDAFHQAASSLSDASAEADSSIAGIVSEINQTTSQIANLNQQIAALQASGGNSGALQSQADQLTTQLASLTGTSSTATDSTPTLATAGGSVLVTGATSYALQVVQGTDGSNRVLNAQGQDITDALTGGSLGGALTMRDSSIPQLTSALDGLAQQFGTAVNAAQTQGFAADGSQGAPIFSLPSGSDGAAAGIGLLITDGSSIAASSDGSSGSSGNLANLLATQTQPLSSGETPSNTYAALVQTIGSASAGVTSDLNSTTAALTQLTTQQSSESGVSIDEETTNLLKYQQAYAAAAQVITTLNSLFSTVLNMGQGQ